MGRLKTWVGSLLRKALQEDREPATTRIDVTGVRPGDAQYPTNPGFLSILRQGYRKNAAFKACVEVIASAISEAPLRVYSAEGVEDPSHPTRRLMRRPNPFLSEAQLWELTSTHYDLVGNAFWHKARSASGQVVELWPLRPDRVKIVSHPDKYIVGYLYSVGSSVDIPIAPRDMVHFPGLRLGDDFFGEPPFLSGMRALDTDNEAQDFVKAMLQNGAVPGHFVGTESETLPPDVIERLEANWERKFGGEKRGKPLFGTKGMSVTKVGLNMQELVLDGLRALAIADICSAMRVPPILIFAKVGLDAGTYANFEIARLVLHDDRVAPRHRLFADILDNDPDLGDGINTGVVLRFDLTEVPAVQPRVLKRREAARLDYQAGLLRLDEARAEAGQEPVGGEEGTAFKAPAPSLLGTNAEDLACGAQFSGHPLGQRILGPRANVERFTVADVRRHHARFYVARNAVLCAAGPVMHAAVAAGAARHFGGMRPGLEAQAEPAPPVAGGPRACHAPASGSLVSVALTLRGITREDPADYAAFEALLRVLDGGMSGRVYQALCVRDGLAYSVDAEIVDLVDATLLQFTSEVAPANLGRVVGDTLGVLSALARRPVPAGELDRVREGYRFSLLAQLDDASAMADWFGAALLVREPLRPSTRLALMSRVSPRDVMSAARRVAQPAGLALAVVGPVSRARFRALQSASRPHSTVASRLRS